LVSEPVGDVSGEENAGGAAHSSAVVSAIAGGNGVPAWRAGVSGIVLGGLEVIQKAV